MSISTVTIITLFVLIVGILIGRLRGYLDLTNRLKDELNLATRILLGLEPFSKVRREFLTPLIAAARKATWGKNVDEPTPVELIKNGLMNPQMKNEAGQRPLDAQYQDRPVDATLHCITSPRNFDILGTNQSPEFFSLPPEYMTPKVISK